MKEIYQHFLSSKGINTDTRTLQEGQLFLALKGDNFDGSNFIKQALQKGAYWVITQNQEYEGQQRVTVVDDALKTLQDLAKHHRLQIKTKIIALTGSNGKTTTKELLYTALSTKFSSYKTEGNLNNHIGVPLSLLRISKDAEIAIIEMGANKLGDIDELCQIALPDFGFITNIGRAHIEGFGSLDGVFKGKTEMYHRLKAENGFAFVDKNLSKLVTLLDILAVSYKVYNAEASQVDLGDESMTLHLDRQGKLYQIDCQLYGKYNVQNYIAAADIAFYFGVSYQDSAEALSAYRSSNMRSQSIQMKFNKVYLDAYNANPTSIKAGIEHFMNVSDSTVLILGDMKELGEDTQLYHQEVVDLLHERDWRKVILIGEYFSKTNCLKKYSNYQSIDLINENLNSEEFKDCKIYVKGSRSMGMEKILDHFK